MLRGIILSISIMIMTISNTQATEIMLARSNGELTSEVGGQYSTLNLLDGDPKTVWCSAGTGKNARIEIVFSGVAKLKRMDIKIGNQSSAASFPDFNRVRRIKVSSGDLIQHVELHDIPTTQKVWFEPVMETEVLVLTLQAGYRGQNRHACLSDILVYQGRRRLNGPKLAQAIRSAKKNQQFIDIWLSGSDYQTKTHRLVFGIKNKYMLRYQPLDPDRHTILKNGRWTTEKGFPKIELDHKIFHLKLKRDELGQVHKIKLSGVDHLSGVYQRKPFDTVDY